MKPNNGSAVVRFEIEKFVCKLLIFLSYTPP